MLGWTLIIVMLSLLSFQGGVYWRLLPRLGVGWAYVLDQGLPLAVAIIALLVTLKKRVHVAAILKRHAVPIAVLLLATLLAHGLVLRYFFFAEDVSTILYRVTNGDTMFAFHPLINGYPFAAFIASFLLFGTKAWLYNVVTFVLFSTSVFLFYGFVVSLSERKTLALLAALFYATTPVFLDVFTWQANAQGMPLVLSAGIISFWTMVLYKKKGISAYYLLSLLFFAAAIKMGFVRIAGILFPLLVLLWLPRRGRPWRLGLTLIQSLPIAAIWYGFVITRLTPGGITTFLQHPQGSVTPSFVTGNYIARLAYYLAHLVVPNGLSPKIFPLIKNALGWLHADILLGAGITVFVGEVALVVCLLLAVGAFFRSRSTTSRMLLFSTAIILGTLFYVPFYISASTDLSRFDWNFARITPPYGPGSRYVFAASLGLGLLFALCVVWLLRKKRRLRLLGICVSVVIIWGNASVSIFHHGHIVRVISDPERAIIGGILRMMPRDGRKKLLFSVNPQRNLIDSNTNNWRWLHGFYRETELYYTNNKEEFDSLMATGAYGKDAVYAFYVNPETHAFADISAFVRNQLNQNDTRATEAIPFSLGDAQAEFRSVDAGRLWLLKRPVLVGSGVDTRAIMPRQLLMQLEIAKPGDIPFPFLDTTIPSTDKRVPYQLWWELRVNPPMVLSKVKEIIPTLPMLSFGDRLLSEISEENRLAVNRLLEGQERLRQEIRVSVSNINTTDPRVSAESLSDGWFASDPAPKKDEKFFLASETPLTLIVRLPFPIRLGRVVFNTPKNMVADHSPTQLSVFASLQGGAETLVGSLANETEFRWSPNNGRLRVVATEHVWADTLRITVSQTTGEPVAFDELVIDAVDALEYSPAQLLELGEKNLWYVPGKAALESITTLSRYRMVTLAYACAEEADWKRQVKNTKSVVPGMWNMEAIPLENYYGSQTIQATIDCRGSMLRQLVVIGPGYPAGLRMVSAQIQ